MRREASDQTRRTARSRIASLGVIDDATAILNLIHTYGALIDAGDFVGIGDLFEHASLRAEGLEPISGAAAITALYEASTRRYPAAGSVTGTPRTQHVITNPIVVLDDTGLTARVRSIYTVFQATGGLALQPIICGGYVDDFEKVDGVWRFAAREMRVSLLGELGRHLAFDPSSLAGE